VEGNRLILGGADIVDGSPVLDIKPYVPFCDSVPGATAPPWVQVRRCGAGGLERRCAVGSGAGRALFPGARPVALPPRPICTHPRGRPRRPRSR
jgi:hypothetical protein